MVCRWRWPWRGSGGGGGGCCCCCRRGCRWSCGGRRQHGRGRRASPAASGRQPFCGTATSSGSLLFSPPLPSLSHPPSGSNASLRPLVIVVPPAFFRFTLQGVAPSSMLFSPFPPPVHVFRFVLTRFLGATLRSIFVSFFVLARLPRTRSHLRPSLTRAHTPLPVPSLFPLSLSLYFQKPICLLVTVIA